MTTPFPARVYKYVDNDGEVLYADKLDDIEPESNGTTVAVYGLLSVATLQVKRTLKK